VNAAEARALLVACYACGGNGEPVMDEWYGGETECYACSGSGRSPEREEALRLLLREEREMLARACCWYCRNPETWGPAEIVRDGELPVCRHTLLAQADATYDRVRKCEAAAIRARQEEP
jgi:hypothetical protein